MQINLENFCLSPFNSENFSHVSLLNQFNGESKSNFISMIDSRLRLNSKSKSFPFRMAFVVSDFSDDLLGYVFISSIRQDEVYLEYSLLKEQRGKGYGSLLLKEVTNYLFENYNIRNIALDIDVSNEASVNTAIRSGYYEDEFINEKRIIYKSYNLNYVNRRKNGR